jgi:hypothetical protein
MKARLDAPKRAVAAKLNDFMERYSYGAALRAS